MYTVSGINLVGNPYSHNFSKLENAIKFVNDSVSMIESAVVSLDNIIVYTY